MTKNWLTENDTSKFVYSFGRLNPTTVCVEKRATSSPPPFFGIGWVSTCFQQISSNQNFISFSFPPNYFFWGEDAIGVCHNLHCPPRIGHHVERNQISFWIIDMLKWLYLNFHKLLEWDLRGPRCVALESSRFCPSSDSPHVPHVTHRKLLQLFNE